MKIDYTFKIKEKYFDAILNGTKIFELRHQYIDKNSIVKLECKNGNYLIYKSGDCKWIETAAFIHCGKKKYNICCGEKYAEFDNQCFRFRENKVIVETLTTYDVLQWYDKFCWDYINKSKTCLSLIDEILEVFFRGRMWINLKTFMKKVIKIRF